MRLENLILAHTPDQGCPCLQQPPSSLPTFPIGGVLGGERVARKRERKRTGKKEKSSKLARFQPPSPFSE